MKIVEGTNFTVDLQDYFAFSDGWYVTLIVYHVVAAILGVLGNILIMVASIRYVSPPPLPKVRGISYY